MKMVTKARDYHYHTAYQRGGLGGHYLDWANKPSEYKTYVSADKIVLDTVLPEPDPQLRHLIEKKEDPEHSRHIGLKELTCFFSMAYRHTIETRFPGGSFRHRTVPSAGGLYPCELYMACQSVDGLKTGLYHYSVQDHCLFRTGADKVRSEIFLPEPTTSSSDVMLAFFVTAVFFRSAWKYRDRSHRYHLLDSGHLLENVMTGLKILEMPMRCHYDFNDSAANDFLHLDPNRETVLAIVTVPGQDLTDDTACTSDAGSEWADASAQYSPLPVREIRYPAVESFFAAACEVRRVDEKKEIDHSVTDQPLESGISFMKLEKWPDMDGYCKSLYGRRSMRNYVPETMEKSGLHALLEYICAADDLTGPVDEIQKDILCLGFLAQQVQGIEPGAYLIDRRDMSYARYKKGSLISQMAHICLDQQWLAGAAMHFFMSVNLEQLDRVFGPRGYRYALLTSGRLGQKIYIAATAIGFGCCGIGAFYDNEAKQLLGLDQNSEMIYLLSVGPVKKRY